MSTKKQHPKAHSPEILERANARKRARRDAIRRMDDRRAKEKITQIELFREFINQFPSQDDGRVPAGVRD